VGFRDRLVAALLGVSAYQSHEAAHGTFDLESSEVQKARRAMGGQLAPVPISQTRWYLSDLEAAEFSADMGDLGPAARLMRAARKDGLFAGVLSTRTGGLVRLPKKFRGAEDIVRELELGHESVRSKFDEMCPPTELGLLAEDGVLLGVGVGELVPVEGRDYPVLVRLEPEFLLYRWSENRWYYKSIIGLLPITPGDGRWVLHTPGGRVAPWQNGLWRAVGRAYIRKEHANLYKDAWEAKLANPARVAVAAAGATEEQRRGWLESVMAWGVNTVFSLSPGYDVRLLESNGRGYESFLKTIADQNNEMIIAVAGQTVTTDGGAGFQNSDIHRSIRSDLIKATGDSLAYTVNTQVLPPYVLNQHGEDALEQLTVMEYDVTPPRDREAEARALQTFGQAVTLVDQALAAHGRELDIEALCAEFSIPVRKVEASSEASSGEKPKLELVREAA
jgi:hypothetical protein